MPMSGCLQLTVQAVMTCVETLVESIGHLGPGLTQRRECTGGWAHLLEVVRLRGGEGMASKLIDRSGRPVPYK